MKKKLCYLACVFLMAFSVHPAMGQPAGEAWKAQVDSVFAAWDKPATPGIAVAIAWDGKVAYAQGYGQANLDHNLPITPETVFLVASVSKQFTAFAIAMLADAGKVSLDDDIRKHIPEMHDFGVPLTLRHLVHHTSGLRDEFDLLGMAGYRMDDVITKDAILKLAYGQRTLNFLPGAEYLYSNTGYTLLAEVVERVTGQSFRAWMDASVFKPLSMAHSHIHDDYQMVVPGAAQGYAGDEKTGFKKQIYSYQSVGASGLFTTVGDLVRWAHNFKTMQVGSPAVHAQMHQQGILNKGDTLSYAFGQSVSTYKGHQRVSHSGWHRGFRTYLARFPDDGLTVVVLANSEGTNAAEQAMKVADILLAPDPASFAAYAGTYYSEELDTSYTVALEGDRLKVQHIRNDTVTLTPDGPDRFTGDQWFFENIRFFRAGERVTHFTVTTTRARNVRFDRRP